jgi:FAD:protein FMN transferase
MRTLHTIRLRKTLVALAAGVFLLLLVQQRQASLPPPVQSLNGSAMGTTWQVQVASNASTEALQTLGDAIKASLVHLDKEVFSTYAPESELSRLNSSAIGKAQVVSRELIEVLLWARTLNKQSFGAFDVTVGPLVNLWGFGPEERQGLPTDAAIAAAKVRLGADKYVVDVRASTATRHADIAIDLSAIAKGYVVDKIAELLLQQGFSHFVFEIGGEVRTQGWRQPERSWHIAIETPDAGVQQAYRAIDTRGEGLAMAGSGDYRNFFEQDGKRYSHEIDPRTGYPIAHTLAAVTVLAATTAEADAWATALMVLGPEDGPFLAEQRGLAAFFIIRHEDGLQSRHTSAIEPYLLAAVDIH